MDVRIQTLIPIHVARIRHVGPDGEVDPCFDRLFRWAQSIGAPTGRALTLSYNDPEKEEPGRLRWDTCVELRTDEELPPGIGMGHPTGHPSRLLPQRQGIDPQINVFVLRSSFFVLRSSFFVLRRTV